MSAHHGNTPAAWTAVTIVLLGFVLGGLALVITSWPLFWIGVACGPIGGIAGLIMARMGHGAEPVGR
jgi:peptidoglycan/LPS O-acetylase OafA/YrhL